MPILEPVTTWPTPSKATRPGVSRTTSTPTTRAPTRASSPGSGSAPTRGRWTSACRCGCRAGIWPSTAPSPRAARDGRHRARGGGRPLRDARGPASRGASPWTPTSPARPCAAAVAPGRPIPSTWRSTCASTPSPRPSAPTGSTPVADPQSAEAAAAAGTIGKGHLEQAGRWTGSLDGRRRRHAWTAAHGNRDRSWGPRRWGGPNDVALVQHQRRRGHALRRHPPGHRRPVTCTGGGCGTAAGPPASAEWRLRTELADDGVTHRVVHLVVRRQGGPGLRPARRRAAGGRHRAGRGHHGQRGAGPVDLPGPRRRRPHRLRHLRVPAPARRQREAHRSGRVSSSRLAVEPMGHAPCTRRRRRRPRPPLSAGPCQDLRRLSGGASRVTSSFDLAVADGTVRSDPSSSSRTGETAWRRAAGSGARRPCSGRPAPPGSPSPAVVAARDGHDGPRPGWLVVERLEGETIPRKILRDPEWSGARAALTAQCGRALAAIHSIDPGVGRRVAAPGPAPATRSPSSTRWARSARPSSWACAGSRPTGAAPASGSPSTVTFASATSWSGPTGCEPCSTGSWPMPATRPRTSAGSAPGPGASVGPAGSAGSVTLDDLLEAYAAAGR